MIPINAIELIGWLVGLGIDLSETDKDKIRAGVEAAKSDADRATERNRALDAPREEPEI